MEQTAKAPQKKGNKTTELIIGTAAAKMESGIKTLLQVVPTIEKLNETILTGTLEVSNLEDKIGGLKQDFINKAAQNKIELQNAYDTDRKEFVDKWLADNDMAVIEVDELGKLNSDLRDAQQTMDNAVKTAVASATGAMKKDNDNAMSLLKLEHEKKEAENKAEITQLRNQVSFMEKQCKMLEDQLTAERTAGVQRAQASSIGSINVGDSGKR